MDKIRALKTFITVAETCSFSSASRKLNISPPSVTRIIGDLEAGLGVKLLNRTTRIVTLTDIGRRYLSDAKQIVEDVLTADEAARGAHQAPSGTLRITASTMFGAIYITPIITEFLDLYPAVKVEALFVDRVVNIFEEGMDVAVRIGHLPDSSFIARRVGQVSLQLCGSPDYFKEKGLPQHPNDLVDHNLIGLDLGGFQSEWHFKDNISIRPEYRLVINSIAAGLEAAKAGWGLIRLVSYQIGPDLDKGAIQTVLHEYAPPILPIHLLHGQGRQSSAKVRAFIDLASKRLKQDPFLN